MKTRRTLTALLALSLLLVAAIEAQADDGATAVKTVTLAIDGMCCPSCLPDIESSLSSVTGVKSAKASFKPAQAIVTYDSAKTDTKALIKAIGKVGYVAKVKPQTAKKS